MHFAMVELTAFYTKRIKFISSTSLIVQGHTCQLSPQLSYHVGCFVHLATLGNYIYHDSGL